MKLAILPSARDDLASGFRFYEAQEQGLGSYFLERLASESCSSKPCSLGVRARTGRSTCRLVGLLEIIDWLPDRFEYRKTNY